MGKNYKDKVDKINQTKYKSNPSSVLGIDFSNNEGQQRFLRLIQKPDLPYIFITGEAGTGKNFVATAAALDLVRMQRRYHDIIYCRAAKEVDDGGGLGFLPGELEEKFSIYCLPLIDTLKSIMKKTDALGGGDGVLRDLMNNVIRCYPPNYVRGNNWDNAIIIIDEAQNMTYDQLQTLMTRITDNCKMIIMGSLNQIDLKNKSVEENGFKLVMDCMNQFQDDGLVGYVELTQSMRSPFCVKIDKALTAFKQARIKGRN